MQNYPPKTNNHWLITVITDTRAREHTHDNNKTVCIRACTHVYCIIIKFMIEKYFSIKYQINDVIFNVNRLYKIVLFIILVALTLRTLKWTLLWKTFSFSFFCLKKKFYQNDVTILNFSTYFCCNFSSSALSLFPCSLWTIP